ncbi:flagellar hook-length control protein FliK [Bradyrhizobium quebecense]|uniref:Flagellar hook-length control protein FliK n=2 Tax=Bradyrhizobium quebecense TaxID=2748629 RepID=A0ACD3VBF6_9BRAD|nr:flagellar hook-length control protein FliK [Bradyrhizobium quebecense]UGY03748.1 flagellar hook-length control protein FliK [Bradyrhizobium quebecense]
MAIAVNPVLPVLASKEADSVAPDLTLEVGSVVNAQVLKVLSADLVRIAIASLSIDVQTEVPLQQGQNLQLAVSQTNDGIRLQLVGPAADAGDTVQLSPGATNASAAPQPVATAPRAVLSPLERITITATAQHAAAVQGSQAPLFANLTAVAAANLPPKLQTAIAQVLAQQTGLNENLSGDAVKAGFQKSGLLLEATLASGVAPPNGSVPDLKAALIVLRQALTSLGAGDATRAASTPLQQPALASAGTAPSIVPSGTPELEVQEILLPQARVPVAEDLTRGATHLAGALADALDAGPSSGGALNLIQEALHELGNPARQGAAPREMLPGDVPARGSTPPPPFHGALPSAQAVAGPSIAPGTPLANAAHRLLENTDAALARQTLLQIASLPDRGDGTRPQLDAMVPRWNFEIPFLTQQGTAMAQFEISRDGGGNEVEAAKRVWRARFTLDVEPAGPVHALVSLNGERTSVRMWAERPSTAAQLRAGASELSQALTRAELTPGDIEIRDGSPPQPAPARAGHFLDRAS